MTRLFVAIDLPEEQKAAVASVAVPLPGARWVPTDQIHLTLRFIGEVDAGQFLGIKKGLERIKSPPFSLALRGVGHFPPGRHPKVLWVGLEQSPPLLHLQKEVELALVKAGVAEEPRRFSPHITLARLHGTPAAGIEELETAQRLFASAPFSVDRFILYSSILKPQGAIHQKEAVYACTADRAEAFD
jgi:RNA 2',3'-cyclic 3'-phosphodiesterase